MSWNAPQLRGRWGVVSFVLGWCALAALALAWRLRRFARRRTIAAEAAATPVTRPQPVTIVRPARPPMAPAPAPIALPIPGKVRRESGEVNARLVFAIIFGWFVFVFVGLAVLMHSYEDAPPYPKPPPDSSYPEPRLILHPFALQPPYLAAQSRALKSGAVPITRAMAEIASRPDPYAPIGAEGSHGK